MNHKISLLIAMVLLTMITAPALMDKAGADQPPIANTNTTLADTCRADSSDDAGDDTGYIGDDADADDTDDTGWQDLGDDEDVEITPPAPDASEGDGSDFDEE